MSSKDVENNIKKIVSLNDFNKGKKINKDFIKFIGKGLSNDGIVFVFNVNERGWWYYNYEVQIKVVNNLVTNACCNCSYKGNEGSCEHIAAVLLNYYEDMVNVDLQKIIQELSKSVINQISRESSNKSKYIREELNLDIVFTKGNSKLGVYLKIGNEHKYSLKQKLTRFLSVYETQRGTIEFGKKLTYDPKKYYFNSQNEDILNFFMDYLSYRRYYEYQIEFDDKTMKKLLELSKGKIFEVNDMKVLNEPINTFPSIPKVTKENNLYKLDLNVEINHIIRFTNDCEYILYKNNIYHLNKQNANLLCKMLENGINRLLFEEKDLRKFNNYIIPSIKDNVEISDDIDNIVIAKKPIPKLYFDIFSNTINCNIKLLYNEIEIDYFSNPKNIVRDTEFEQSILEELKSENFIIEDKKIYLDDIDDIGNFLEVTLPKLSEKYEIFTSKKLQDTNLLSKININSMFSIGIDNIMNFTFDIEGISNKEIDNIFKTLKENKKYYKLKNGNILKLENNNDISNFENLIEELEVTKENIENGNVVIPKYRAIYLDSLNNKYNFIKTNNLFKDFINRFKEYKNTSIDFSKKEESVLRDYQLTGAKWLYNIHKCDLGGILADEMGLGKSIQVIYFIKKLLEENKESKFLIVVPTSLVYNWDNEFKKFAPKINYHIFAEQKEKRHKILNDLKTNVYITSYGLLREDYEEFYSNIEFKVSIIDEAQNIKNPMTAISKTVKKINAETKVALTGTPLENSVLELWSIFDYIMPGFLSGLKKFQSKYKVNDFDDETNVKLDKLNKLISPFILRRKKQDVLKDLPDKIENNIYIDLTDEQKKIYAAEVKKVNEEMDRLVSQEGFLKARFMILQLLTKLRQLCIDPSLIYSNYKNESSKMENLIKVIKESIENNHKILIFTSFKKALDLVENKLAKEKIKCYTISGEVSSKKRMDLVDKFNNEEDVKVFIITLKSGGTGLNLTSADIVIHLDLWWNPQVENQATDRAHRIGQKNVVEVVKLITKGTIEEKILELQQKKKTLNEKIIEGNNKDDNLISSLTEKDIKKLLSYENND